MPEMSAQLVGMVGPIQEPLPSTTRLPPTLISVAFTLPPSTDSATLANRAKGAAISGCRGLGAVGVDFEFQIKGARLQVVVEGVARGVCTDDCGVIAIGR